MEATNCTQPAEVSRVAVRLAPFWAERPAVWFAQAEAQFSLASISTETTKFYHVIAQLGHRYAAEVEDVITSLPQQDPYTKLKSELLKRLSPSKEQRAQQLLTFEEMGDRKPSQFLRHLRGLALDVPDYLLHTIWTDRLPTKVQTTLACHPEIELDAAALCADRIMETVLPPVLASTGQPTDTTELLRRIEELSRRVETLSTERNRPRSRDRSPSSRDRDYSPRDRPSNPRIRRPYNRSPSRHDAPTTFCWYH
jgi:hypothetical protein